MGMPDPSNPYYQARVAQESVDRSDREADRLQKENDRLRAVAMAARAFLGTYYGKVPAEAACDDASVVARAKLVDALRAAGVQS